MFGKNITLKDAFAYGVIAGTWGLSGTIWFLVDQSPLFTSDVFDIVKYWFYFITILMVYFFFREMYRDITPKKEMFNIKEAMNVKTA